MRQGEALSHPLGIGANALACRLQNADAREQVAVARIAQSLKAGEKGEGFKAGHVRVEGDRLRQIADDFARGHAARGVAVNLDAALRRREQAEQHFHQGRFARAVMPGKGDRFPRVDVDIDIADRGKTGKNFSQLRGSQ